MVSTLKRIFKIFQAELANIFSDKGVFLIMVGGIFLYGLFYMMPFSNHIARNIPIGIVDNDNSELSRKLIRNLNANEMLWVKARPKDVNEAKEQYYKQDINAFVVIPKDFEKDVKLGKNSFITSYTDSAFMIVYKQVATGINAVISGTNTFLVINRLMKKGINKHRALAIESPFEFISIPLYNPVGSYQNYIYPLVLIMILQQTMLIGVSMLCGTESEQLSGMKFQNQFGVVQNLKLNRINEYSTNPAGIVFGRSLAHVSLYFIYSLIYFLIFPKIVVYHMSYKIVMFLILIPFLFATSFWGQSMVTFCKKRENSLFILIISSVPFIFLPGFVWPKESISALVNCIAKFIPTTSAIDGLVKINQMNADISYITHDLLILLTLCGLYFTCAIHTIAKSTT